MAKQKGVIGESIFLNTRPINSFSSSLYPFMFSDFNFYLFENPTNNSFCCATFSVGLPTALQGNLKVSNGVREGVKAGYSKTTRRSVSPSQMHYLQSVEGSPSGNFNR